MYVTDTQTNERTDERKGENYIPLGINTGGIIKVSKSTLTSDVVKENFIKLKILL